MKFFSHWMEQQEEGGGRRDAHSRQGQKFLTEHQGEGRQ